MSSDQATPPPAAGGDRQRGADRSRPTTRPVGRGPSQVLQAAMQQGGRRRSASAADCDARLERARASSTFHARAMLSREHEAGARLLHVLAQPRRRTSSALAAQRIARHSDHARPSGLLLQLRRGSYEHARALGGRRAASGGGKSQCAGRCDARRRGRVRSPRLRCVTEIRIFYSCEISHR